MGDWVIPSLDMKIGSNSRNHVTLMIALMLNGHLVKTSAMVDSGATGNFVDANLAETLGLPTVKKGEPEPVQAVDGKPLTSGPITENTGPISMEVEDHKMIHREDIQFNIIDAPQYGFILGLPWLTLHNPSIDWKKTMQFMSSSCHKTCLIPGGKPVSMLATLTIAKAAEKDVVLPEVYSNLADVFDKRQAELLPRHRPYDCQIDLIAGALLPSCRIYALSKKETTYGNI